jgi:hypothetical protein
VCASSRNRITSFARHFVRDRLDALLELAAVFRPGDEPREVESTDDSREATRDVARTMLRESLDDGGLSGAGVAASTGCSSSFQQRLQHARPRHRDRSRHEFRARLVVAQGRRERILTPTRLLLASGHDGCSPWFA